MTFGSGGLAPPLGLSPQLQHWYAQLVAEIRRAQLGVPVYTDATRPDPGNVGHVIFNTDDGQLNVDDGTNWTLPDGTTT